MASIPPTARTAWTPSTMTIVIFTANWKRSVTSTPHRPESVEMNDVRAIMPMTIQRAWSFETPSTSTRILTIARLTQPRMMQFISTPR